MESYTQWLYHETNVYAQDTPTHESGFRPSEHSCVMLSKHPAWCFFRPEPHVLSAPCSLAAMGGLKKKEIHMSGHRT